MAIHQANLVLRFILELAVLFITGLWGWHQAEGILKYFLAIGFPLAFAIIWGVFSVKNDPSRSGKTVVQTRGYLRIILEFGIFGFAVWALFSLEHITLSVIFLSLVLLHYFFSFNRITWLLKQ